MWEGTIERRYIGWRIVSLVVALACTSAGSVLALGDIVYPGRGPHAWPARAVRVEVADAELFGVPGLRASGIRASVPVWRLSATVELVRVGSNVASEPNLRSRSSAMP